MNREESRVINSRINEINDNLARIDRAERDYKLCVIGEPTKDRRINLARMNIANELNNIRYVCEVSKPIKRKYLIRVPKKSNHDEYLHSFSKSLRVKLQRVGDKRSMQPMYQFYSDKSLEDIIKCLSCIYHTDNINLFNGIEFFCEDWYRRFNNEVCRYLIEVGGKD